MDGYNLLATGIGHVVLFWLCAYLVVRAIQFVSETIDTYR